MVDKMRLIDADALMDAFNESDRDSALAEYVFNTFIKLLYMSPTIDAVEVVRCRDCKWWRDDGCGDAYCRLVGVGFSRNRDGFCNYGEREGE